MKHVLAVLTLASVIGAGQASYAGEGESCGTHPVAKKNHQGKLSKKDFARVVRFASARILAAETTPSPEQLAVEIKTNLGIDIPGSEYAPLKEAVVRELRKSPKGLAKLVPSRCDQYGACSLEGDLSGATGATLVMYEREKSEDGRSFTDFPVPDFQARDLAGHAVHSSALRGREALLVQLAGHCDHSIASLRILQNLVRTHRARGLRVIALFVNSGSVADIKTWLPRYKPEFEVWVHEDASVGDRLGSHLTPTYFYVDGKGSIKRKLVGMKSEDEVRAALSSLLAFR